MIYKCQTFLRNPSLRETLNKIKELTNKITFNLLREITINSPLYLKNKIIPMLSSKVPMAASKEILRLELP
jgi:hypothetical protein